MSNATAFLDELNALIDEFSGEVTTIAIPFADEGYVYISHMDTRLATIASKAVMKEFRGYMTKDILVVRTPKPEPSEGEWQVAVRHPNNEARDNMEG